MTVVLNSSNEVSIIYQDKKEVYRSVHYPVKTYLNVWATNHKAAVLVGKRIFFISSKYELVSLLMDKAAIDRRDHIDTVYHKLDGMTSIWADKKQVVCLNKIGVLDIVNYAGKYRAVVSTRSLIKEIFTADRPFQESHHETVSVTGCTQFLAVAKYERSSYIGTVALMDRKGRFMSMASDSGIVQRYAMGNPIHRMEFCLSKRSVFLVAQNLFSAVSLFAVNSKSMSVIHLIREILIKQGEFN